MSGPTSLRLPDDESRRVSAPPSTLAVALIDEGLRRRRFPGIVFRDGPTGRRAGLAKGPDVWEVVRDLKRAHGTGREPLGFVADQTGLAPELIGLAADYYALYPEEIDGRIAADIKADEELRELADQRERMLSL